jgi:hypothetical protein
LCKILTSGDVHTFQVVFPTSDRKAQNYAIVRLSTNHPGGKRVHVGLTKLDPSSSKGDNSERMKNKY